MSSKRITSTSPNSSTGSSDRSDISGIQRNDYSDSSAKQLLINAAVEALGTKAPSLPAGQKNAGPSRADAVGGIGRGVAKPGVGTARGRLGSASSGTPWGRSEESTDSVPLSPAQQKLPGFWKRPQDQRGGRRGRGKLSYDEEGMMVTPPMGVGRGAAGRGRAVTRPRSVTSPPVRGPAQPPAAVRPTVGQTGVVQPGARQPVRPRLVLSKKGLVKAAPAKSMASIPAAETSSAQPATRGAEATAQKRPIQDAVDPRRTSGAVALASAQQRRSSVAFPETRPRSMSAVSVLEFAAGRRPSAISISDNQGVSSAASPWSAETRRLSSGSQDQAEKAALARDEESSSSSPPRDDSVTPPAGPPLRRPSMAVRPFDAGRRPSMAVKLVAAGTAPGAAVAAAAMPPQMTGAATPLAEQAVAADAASKPPQMTAGAATPSAEAEKAFAAEAAAPVPAVPSATSAPGAQPPAGSTTTKSALLKKSEAPPASAQKSNWWTALARPFSLPGSALGNVTLGLYHDEAAVAPQPAERQPHPRRYSIAPVEGQRAQARSNVKLKRAPHVSDDLKDFAALLGSAVGFSGGAQQAPPSATGYAGRQAAQQNESIEDYLDYEYGPRLQQSLESEGSDVVTHRRHRGLSLFGLCARCLVLLILICAATSLLFFTFRLGQNLTKNLRTPDIMLPTASTTTTSTSTAATKDDTTSASEMTTAATTLSTAAPLPPTEELYDDDADRPTTCETVTYPPSKVSLPLYNASDVPYNESAGTQYRKLLCVIDTKYFSPKRPYVLKLLPTAYCSEVIFYAVYADIGTTKSRVYAKHSPTDVEIIRQLVYLKLERTHRGEKLRLHVTLGGSRYDSPNIVQVLERYDFREGVVEGLVNASLHVDGVNIHWDRPGDQCDQEFTPAYLRAFMEALYLKNMSLILTVPPVLELVQKFWLISLTRYVDYIIVTTHTLRRKGVLDCSGRREFAAASYLAIREHVLKETANPFQAAKVVYSIALGADVFRATLPLSSPRLLDAGTPSSIFDGPTMQTNKTSYDHVCRMPKGVFDGDSECAYAIRQQGTGGTELALYAGPEELAERMRRSYASKIGDTTVAVYDMYLDDFSGNCMSAGGPTTQVSPLVAAIAETGL